MREIAYLYPISPSFLLPAIAIFKSFLYLTMSPTFFQLKFLLIKAIILIASQFSMVFPSASWLVKVCPLTRLINFIFQFYWDLIDIILCKFKVYSMMICYTCIVQSVLEEDLMENRFGFLHIHNFFPIVFLLVQWFG